MSKQLFYEERVRAEMDKELYFKINPELREEIEVQTVEPKEEDFSEDPIWQELKSKSTKAYKNLKNYEFDKRQQRHD